SAYLIVKLRRINLRVEIAGIVLGPLDLFADCRHPCLLTRCSRRRSRAGPAGPRLTLGDHGVVVALGPAKGDNEADRKPRNPKDDSPAGQSLSFQSLGLTTAKNRRG